MLLVIVMRTHELHSEMESCNKYQLFGSIIPTHDHEVSPDPQQTSPGPYLLLFMVFFNFDINVLFVHQCAVNAFSLFKPFTIPVLSHLRI